MSLTGDLIIAGERSSSLFVENVSGNDDSVLPKLSATSKTEGFLTAECTTEIVTNYKYTSQSESSLQNISVMYESLEYEQVAIKHEPPLEIDSMGDSLDNSALILAEDRSITMLDSSAIIIESASTSNK